MRNVHFRFPSVAQKRRFLKLSNVRINHVDNERHITFETNEQYAADLATGREGQRTT